MKNTHNISLEEAFDKAFPQDAAPPSTLHARIANIAEDTDRQKSKQARGARWQWKKRYVFALGLVGIIGAISYSFVPNHVGVETPLSIHNPMRAPNVHLVRKSWDGKRLVKKQEVWKRGNDWVYYSESLPYQDKKETYLFQEAMINGILYTDNIKDTQPSQEYCIPREFGSIEKTLEEISGNKNEIIKSNKNEFKQFILENNQVIWLDAKTNMFVRSFSLPQKPQMIPIGKSIKSQYTQEITVDYNVLPPPKIFDLPKEMLEAKDINLARLIWQQKIEHPVQIKKLNQTELRILSVDVNKQGDVFIAYALPEGIRIGHEQRFRKIADKKNNGGYIETSGGVSCRGQVNGWQVYSICAMKNDGIFTPTSLSLKFNGSEIDVNTPLSKITASIWADIVQDDFEFTFPITAPTCDVVPEVIRVSSYAKNPIDAWEYQQSYQKLQSIYYASLSWDELEKAYRKVSSHLNFQNHYFLLRWAEALTALGREEEAKILMQKLQIDLDKFAKNLSPNSQKKREKTLAIELFLHRPLISRPRYKGDKHAYNPLREGSSYLKQEFNIVVKKERQRKGKIKLPKQSISNGG
jgi:hypothetical protein